MDAQHELISAEPFGSLLAGPHSFPLSFSFHPLAPHATDLYLPVHMSDKGVIAATLVPHPPPTTRHVKVDATR